MRLLFCVDDTSMSRYSQHAAGFLTKLASSFKTVDCLVFTDAKDRIRIPFNFSNAVNAPSGMICTAAIFRKFMQHGCFDEYDSFIFMLPHHLVDEITLLALRKQIRCHAATAIAAEPHDAVLHVPYLGSSAIYRMLLEAPFCVNLLSIHEQFQALASEQVQLPAFVPAPEVPGIRRSFKAPIHTTRFAIIAGRRTGTNVHFHYMLSSIAARMKGEFYIGESLAGAGDIAPIYEKNPWLCADCAVFVGEDGSNSHVASLRRHKYTIVVNDSPYSPIIEAADAAFLCDCRDFIREFNSRLKKVNFRLKNSTEKRF